MQLNTPIAGAMEASYGKEQYDAQVKKMLSDKQILAWILKYTTAEFKEYPIEEIIEAIEGTPEPDEKTPKLQRLLHTLFSRKMKPQERSKVLNEDFGIQRMQDWEGENLMCNLSDLIEEEGIQKGILQGMQQGKAQEQENGIRILIEAYREDDFSREAICRKVQKKYELTPEEAEQYMEKYWK